MNPMVDRIELLMREARYGEAWDAVTTLTKLMMHKAVRIAEAVELQQSIARVQRAHRAHKGLAAAANNYERKLMLLKRVVEDARGK